jgi:hypothetical protein
VTRCKINVATRYPFHRSCRLEQTKCVETLASGLVRQMRAILLAEVETHATISNATTTIQFEDFHGRVTRSITVKDNSMLKT